MKRVKNTLKNKLLLLTIVVVGLMFLMSMSLMFLTRQHSDQFSDALIKMSEVKAVIDTSDLMRQTVSDYVITKNPQLLIDYDQLYTRSKNDIAIYAQTMPDDLQLEFYYLENLWTSYSQQLLKIVDAQSTGVSSTEIQLLFKEAILHQGFVKEQVAVVLSDLIDLEEKNTLSAIEHISISQYILVVFALLFTLILIAISNQYSKRLTRPISGLIDFLHEIGKGRFESTIAPDILNGQDDLAEIALSVDKMKNQLALAFKEIQDHNENLDAMVYERTLALEEINIELEASLRSLTETQALLIESEKEVAMQQLIRHLAHRLNTPLGTAITATSYLNSKLEGYLESNEKISFNELVKGLELISESQLTLNSFVEKIRELLIDFDTKPRRVSFKKLIEDASTQIAFRNNVKCLPIVYEVDCSQGFLLPQQGLNMLFLNMFSLSTAIQTESSSISINLIETEQSLSLHYRDKTLNQYSSLIEILKEKIDMQVHMDDLGLEVYIMKNIVSRGCNGKLLALTKDTQLIGFEIVLPKVGDENEA